MYSADFALLTLASQTWSHISADRDTASWAPYGHTLNVIRSQLYAYGGIGHRIFDGRWEEYLLDNIITLDLFKLENGNAVWEIIEVNPRPNPRTHHVSVS